MDDGSIEWSICLLHSKKESISKGDTRFAHTWRFVFLSPPVFHTDDFPEETQRKSGKKEKKVTYHSSHGRDGFGGVKLVWSYSSPGSSCSLQ